MKDTTVEILKHDTNPDTKKVYFNGWFYIDIPLAWDYEIEEDLLNIYDDLNGEGCLQISFLTLGETKIESSEFLEAQMRKFIKQFGIVVSENKDKVSDTSRFMRISAVGKDDEDFIKIWVLGKDSKMLLITYINALETEEINIAENIVNSVQFDDE